MPYSKYETSAGMPTESLAYDRLIEHLKLGAEAAYTLGHLKQGAGHSLTGQGFLAIGQLLERATTIVVTLATKGTFQ